MKFNEITLTQELAGGPMKKPPMTTMMVDVKTGIKLEPGMDAFINTKKEKNENTDKEADTTAETPPGELFNQLLGEVHKLNEQEEEKKSDDDSVNKVKEGEETSRPNPKLRLPPGISVSKAGASAKQSQINSEEERETNDSSVVTDKPENDDDMAKGDTDDGEESQSTSNSSNTKAPVIPGGMVYNHSDYEDLVGK